MITINYTLTNPNYDIYCRMYKPYDDIKQIVIGVHGFAGDKDSSVLLALAKQLCNNHQALVCFDFVAHGESKASDDYLRVHNCISDLKLVIKDVKASYPNASYAIFATSFGAYITLLCINELEEFDIVLRAPAITIADSFIDIIVPVSKEQFFKDGGAICGFERKMFVTTHFYQDLLDYKIPDFTHPLTIIHGSEDDIIPYQAVARFVALYNQCKLVTIEGSNHRFKKDGELEQVLDASLNVFLNKKDRS